MQNGGRKGDQSAAFSWHLAVAVFAAVIGSGFQHGYNTGVVNAPQQLIETWIYDVVTNRSNSSINGDVGSSEVTAIWSLAVSMFCVGGMIGGAFTGIIADRIGRRDGLLWNNLWFLGGAALQASAKTLHTPEVLWAGRLLSGIGSGLGAGLAPMYLAEIAPVSLRGAIGTVYQLVITLSILISQALGLSGALGSEDFWPLLLGFGLLPALIQLLTLPWCPESPSRLAAKGRKVEAEKALLWLRGDSTTSSELTTLTTNNHKDLDKPANDVVKTSNEPQTLSVFRLLKSRLTLVPLMVTCCVMLAQQFSGINAVMFYSTSVFRSAGLREGEQARYATLGMGTINVLATIVSLFLVEKLGRRILLLAGLGGMCINSVGLTAALYFASEENAGASNWAPALSVLLVFSYVTLFAAGPGSIPWFLAGELFDDKSRPSATTVAVVVNWGANFIVGLGFLPLQEALGAYVFLVFAGLLALFAIFVYFKVPETKNKTHAEIQRYFTKQK
ncbi:LOW QUALITY PROTEIN: solute carrier family 2, facilitated glucose transporter member 3-like [Ctenocephalides felis]|uniref:LOW QUALITY PROTEIN: solute carrier family 2, facilitated glucose transporter member 3-like n=1 Tax=Ctenocephalides felis TaxID=7515 RepID=UPI000E6E30D7|nr:LOW QUALITY PROTEIN: solute carrier family 2, facilitated glucose transporter member 3-like [Ctenocephalides felis]